MKRAFKYVKLMTAVVVSFAAVALTGCSEENELAYVTEGAGGAAYVKWGEAGCTLDKLIVSTDGYIGDKYAVTVTYEMFTNCSSWEIVPDYSECYDSEYKWIESWPSKGNHDGRFTLKFQPNTRQGDTRCAKVNVVSGGKVIRSIEVEQAKANITQLYIQPFLQTLNFQADDQNIKSIPLDANVAWTARVNDDENGDPIDWIVISGVTKGKFDVSVLPNTSSEPRVGTVTVFQNTNGNNNLIVTINQAGLVAEETPVTPGEGENNGGEGGNI